MIDNAALLKLIYAGHERTNVEYKRSISWAGDMRFKLMKTIMAMGNLGGGYVVVGFDEGAESLSERAVGVSEVDLGTWTVTDVCRDLNARCQPPIDLDIVPIRDDERNATFVVLRVPSHGSEPFLCTKNQHSKDNEILLKAGAVYYRSKDKSCGEIVHQEDWRDLITRCTLKRKTEMIRDIDAIMNGLTTRIPRDEPPRRSPLEIMGDFYPKAKAQRPPDTTSLMFRELLCSPRFGWPATSIDPVRRALAESSYDYKGWPYIFILPNPPYAPTFGNGTIEAVSNDPFFDRVLFYYWIFRYSTGHFYSQDISSESALGHTRILDPQVQVELTAESLLSVGRLYSSLGISSNELVEITLRYTGLEGAQVATISRAALRPWHSAPFSDSHLTVSRDIQIARLLNSPGKEASAFVMEVIGRLGYQGTQDESSLALAADKFLSKEQKEHVQF